MSKKGLLEWAFEQDITPVSPDFKAVSEEWLAMKYPEIEEDRRKMTAKSFSLAAKKRWKECEERKDEFLSAKWSSNHFDFSESPSLRGGVHSLMKLEPEDSTLVPQKRARKKTQRFEYEDFGPGGAAVMLASPEDAIADMLRTHASDDAAFVFEELMENPMEIGKEVAAFLRRRKAKKQAEKVSSSLTIESNGGGACTTSKMSGLGGPLATPAIVSNNLGHPGAQMYES